MLMCNHNWVLIEKPRHLKYDYSGLEVVIGKCRCTKCKKIKDRTCQGSVPVAIRCFLESDDYESFLRNVFSLKCDMDTLCAIGGGIAEEFYHGTGLDDNYLLGHYLNRQLYRIVEM